MLPPTDRRELFALKKGSKMAELLEVKNLSVSFDTPDGEAEAVRDVSFCKKRGNAGDRGRVRLRKKRSVPVYYEAAPENGADQERERSA